MNLTHEDFFLLTQQPICLGLILIGSSLCKLFCVHPDGNSHGSYCDTRDRDRWSELGRSVDFTPAEKPDTPVGATRIGMAALFVAG